MKLITEEVQKVNFITEGRGASKKMFIEGTFLQGGVKNRNNREYPVHILEREVIRYNETFVQKGRALGELGHPDGPTVNLDRVSHMITSLVREGNNFKGRAQLLSTPMGKIAQSLIGEGVTLGVSSRGVGSLLQTNEGHKVVGEDFMLATAADLVADPSAPDAFVQGIMEGKEWCWDGGILKEQAAKKTYKRINTLVDQKILDEHKVNLFQEFLSNL
jgi:Prohead core protein serine protease